MAVPRVTRVLRRSLAASRSKILQHHGGCISVRYAHGIQHLIIHKQGGAVETLRE